jgi:hypothetical protein
MALGNPTPCFVRIDLGEPDSVPLRWAVWDHYDFASGRYDPPYVANVFHEAMGDAYASLSGNAVSSKSSMLVSDKWWASDKWTLKVLLEHAEAMSPTRAETSRRAHIFALARRNFSRQDRRIGWFLTLVLIAGLVVGPFIYVFEEGGLSAAFGAMPYLVGFALLVLLLINLGPLIRRARQPKGPVEGMRAVADTLRSAGFEDVKLSRAKQRDGLPVVCREDGALVCKGANLWLSRLVASCSSPHLTLEADLCHVRYPRETIDACRIVPDRWLLVEVVGADEDLAGIPVGIREERRDGKVRWLLTGEDLDAGRAAALFHALRGKPSGVVGAERPPQ